MGPPFVNAPRFGASRDSARTSAFFKKKYHDYYKQYFCMVYDSAGKISATAAGGKIEL